MDGPADKLSVEDRAAFAHRKKWLQQAWARGGKQVPPTDRYWEVLIWRAGRGWGKTLSLAEWLFWEVWQFPNLIGHFIGATLGDVRGTLFEGPAGLQAVIPPECLYGGAWFHAYNKNDKEVHLAQGSVIRGYAVVDEGNRLRGPQAHCASLDEVATWDRPAGNLKIAYNNAAFGVRLQWPDGRPARMVLGTTPRPLPFLRQLEKQSNVITVHGTSYENLPNLAPSYRSKLLANEGTVLGRQEILAEYLDDESIGIIKRSWFRLWPAGRALPAFSFLLTSYDTAMKEEDYDKKVQETDPTACQVWGLFTLRQCFSEQELKKMGCRGTVGAVLCDAWSEHLGFPDLLERARAQHLKKWGKTPGRKTDIVLIEAKASGISLRQSLEKYHVPAWPFNTQQSKTMRCHAMAPYAKQGCFFMPESAHKNEAGVYDRLGQVRDWCEPVLEQICAFAGEGSVPFDDHVDAWSQMGIYLSLRNLLDISPQERPDPDPEEKKAADEKEAVRIHEQHKPRVNPYAVAVPFLFAIGVTLMSIVA